MKESRKATFLVVLGLPEIAATTIDNHVDGDAYPVSAGRAEAETDMNEQEMLEDLKASFSTGGTTLLAASLLELGQEKPDLRWTKPGIKRLIDSGDHSSVLEVINTALEQDGMVFSTMLNGDLSLERIAVMAGGSSDD